MPKLVAMLSWEGITAVATAISALVVAATVALSVRQIRLAADQLQHLRRSTQLAGTMEMLNRLMSHELSEALRFVQQEMPARMNDEAFRSGVALIGLADTAVHREIIVMRVFEELGGYVKHGLLDGEIFYDFAAPPIIGAWETLERAGVIAMHREAKGFGMWENFEQLYSRTKSFADARGPDYVKQNLDSGRI
ncbi:MAG: hypothetical protein NVSMB64_03850 [Candidatus Velthaea sp.]